MIILVTGTPGAGKTLFSVAVLLSAYGGQVLKHEDGTEYPRRVLVDGIKNLIVPHELMAPTRTSFDGEVMPDQEGEGLHNWYQWCKPGDVIVVDEVQRYWRPRGNGTKVPRMIAELETHRHKGVDFVIITQHPMLIDQNVRRLVGRHIHIRRMWGGSRAVRYEWDHCSSPDRVGDASKSYWPYPKDAFKFYKSAEVHTKQGGRPPLALAALGLAMVALPVIAYTAVSRVQGMLNPAAQPAIAATAQPSPLAPPVLPQAAQAGEGGAALAATPSTGMPQVFQLPEVAGCIATATRCGCFAESGRKLPLPEPVCRQYSTEVQTVKLSPSTQPATIEANPI